MMYKDYGKMGGDWHTFTADLRELADAIDAGTTGVTWVEVNTDAQADRPTKVQIILGLEIGFVPIRRKPT